MTPAEAAVLLAAISANDNREVTESASRAWSAALPDVDLADALEILPGYYRDATRETRNWIYPGDVLERARELHRDRKRGAMEAARVAAIEAFVPPAEDDPRYWTESSMQAGFKASIAASRKYDDEHNIPGRTRKEIEAADAAKRETEAWMR